MAGTEDIEIDIKVQTENAEQNFRRIMDQADAIESTFTKKASPSISNFGTKLTNAGNKISGFGHKIKNALSTEAALAFTAAGTAALNFAKQCVSSAIQSEAAWTRFGALAGSATGGWQGESLNSMKSWTKEMSNQWGYSVADTREAASTLLQYGFTVSEVKSNLQGVAGLAARTGMTESEAATMVTSAMNGRFTQLSKYTGLQKEEFMNADGTINKTKLLTALYNQNSDALKAHGNTTEAQIQRMNNAWSGFKTSIGNALMPVAKIIADVVTAIANGFNSLPDSVKTVIAVILVIAGAVGAFIGVLGMIAPALISLGGMLSAIGTAGSVAAYVAPAMAGLSTVVGGLMGALSSLLLPILAVAAAFIALYAIGLQMGWWSDLGGMVQKFGEVLGQVAGIMGEFIGWFVKLFTDFPAAQAQFNDFINGIVQWASDGLKQLVNIGWERIQGFGASIIEGLQSAFDSLPGDGILDTILHIFFPLPMLIADKLKEIGPKAATTITESASSIGQSFQSWIDSAWKTLQGWGASILGIFNQLQTYFWRGVNVIIGFGFSIGNAFLTWVTNTWNTLSGWGASILGVFNQLQTWFIQGVNVIISFGTSIGAAFMTWVTAAWNTLSGIGTQIYNAFMTIPGRLQQAFLIILVIIQAKLLQLRMAATMLIQNLVIGIITRFNTLVARVRMVWNMVVTAIRSTLMRAVTIAYSLANQIRTRIVQAFTKIVAKARSIFTQIVSAIRSKLASAVSAARSKALEIFNGIKEKISNIPQMVADEFGKIPGKITSALSSAASAAASGAAGIVGAFKSALGIASPGHVQRLTSWEFGSLPGIISDEGTNAIKDTTTMARGIAQAWQDNFVSPITQFNAFNPMEAAMQNMHYTASVVGSNMTNPEHPGMRPPGNHISNSNITHDGSNTNIYNIDKIELDCHNLSTAESRTILYKALDGLYTGGV